MSTNEKEKNLKVEINDTELKGVAGGDNLPNEITPETVIMRSAGGNVGGNVGGDNMTKFGKGRRKFES